MRTGKAGPARASADSILQALFIAVWLLTLVRVPFSGHLPAWPATLLMAVLVVASLTVLRRRAIPLIAGLGVAALALAAWRGDWHELYRGLEQATVFVAFFGTLIALRTTAERRPETIRARERFAVLDAGRRDGATMLGAHLTGAVLVVGAHALLSPVYGPKSPEAVRFRGALAAQRGIGLAGLWSPFWVAMVVTYQHLPDVPLWAVMGLGIALAVPGLMFGRALRGGLHRDGIAPLLPLVPPVTIAAATVVALSSFTPLAPHEALALGIPLLCLAALLPFGRRALREVLARTAADTRSVLGELTLLSCAFMLGRVLVGLLADLQAADWLDRNMPPAPIVIGGVIAATTLLSMIGVHQIVTITALLVLLVESPSGVADLVLMEAALIGWGFSAMVGLSAVSTVAAAAMFGVPVERVAWSANARFCLAFGLFATAALSIVNLWTV